MKRVHDAGRNRRLLFELLNDQIAAVAHVNHHRQRRVSTKLQVTVKEFVLQIDRRIVPVAIEPRFTNRTNAGIARQFFDDPEVTIGGFGGRIGLNSHGREQEIRGTRPPDHRPVGWSPHQFRSP